MHLSEMSHHANAREPPEKPVGPRRGRRRRGGCGDDRRRVRWQRHRHHSDADAHTDTNTDTNAQSGRHVHHSVDDRVGPGGTRPVHGLQQDHDDHCGGEWQLEHHHGPLALVLVTGSYNSSTGAFADSGTGTVAGFNNVPISMTGTMSGNSITFSQIQLGPTNLPTNQAEVLSGTGTKQ